MLKEILSISGKPGLFKLVSQGKNMYVAESLVDQKRLPVYPRDKVISLGDIAIYTEEEEIPLASVLSNMKTKENGNPVKFNPNIQPDELRTYFETVLPDFDKDRVYPSDIKKIMNWYNILVGAGITNFNESKTEDKEETGFKEKTADKTIKKESKPKAKAETKVKANTKAKAAPKASTNMKSK